MKKSPMEIRDRFEDKTDEEIMVILEERLTDANAKVSKLQKSSLKLSFDTTHVSPEAKRSKLINHILRELGSKLQVSEWEEYQCYEPSYERSRLSIYLRDPES